MSTGILNYTTSLRDYLWEKGIEEHPALKELLLETASLYPSFPNQMNHNRLVELE